MFETRRIPLTYSRKILVERLREHVRQSTRPFDFQTLYVGSVDDRGFRCKRRWHPLVMVRGEFEPSEFGTVVALQIWPRLECVVPICFIGVPFAIVLITSGWVSGPWTPLAFLALAIAPPFFCWLDFYLYGAPTAEEEILAYLGAPVDA